MTKTQFKTESKRMLDLMINSIYTHKEVFLRELISNAGDALEKLYFLSLTGEHTGLSRDQLFIGIAVDKEARTLTISDNGYGMTKEELAENLGTIAKSGTLAFRNEHEDETNSIGQFGVGFYSAFMVSKNIVVKSRAFGSDQAYCWESAGGDGYTITTCEKAENGTEITLYIREDSEDENYSQYLDQYTISRMVKKYSDYISFPIIMDMERSRPKEGAENEFEQYMESETLNSMVPIWRKMENELTDEEYNNFYQDKFFDYSDPLRVINIKVEGVVTYNALLYIPSELPFDYYAKSYKKGLQLYCNGVMIMESCDVLLPDYFGFVKGIVESPDFSLNISREMLQHDRQLKLIAKNIEKKIRGDLGKLMKDEPEKYLGFYKNFGLQLKYGMYADFGVHKEDLKDLVLFYSLAEDKLISFRQYVEKMPEEQQYIYYACGESPYRISTLPQTDLVRDKGYDILCLTDDVDEFAIKMLEKYDDKEFKSVSDNDLGLETAEEKDQLAKKAEENKPLLEQLTNALSGKVKEVRLSARMKNHPVCLTSDGPLSLDMEKVLNSMPTEQKVKAERVLEINSDHPVFKALTKAADNQEKIAEYAQLLYNQALLISGMPIEDPVAFSNGICRLMADVMDV